MEKVKKDRYKVVLHIKNGGFQTTEMYKIQTKFLWWWIDVTNPNTDKELIENCCKELNNYNK